MVDSAGMVMVQEKESQEGQDQGAMAPPGGRGGLLTLRVALGMPGVEDAAEEDHQAMEDQALAMEDQEDTEVICLVLLY